MMDETKVRALIAKLRQQALETDSEQYRMSRLDPDWNTVATVYREIAEELEEAFDKKEKP